MKTLLFTIAVLIGVTSGASGAVWKKRTVKTAAYDKIMVSGDFEVKLVYGTEGAIAVSGERNQINELVVVSDGKILKIYPKKGFRKWCDDLKSIEITIPFESLDEVVLAGSGRIICEDIIKASQLQTSISGTGRMVLSVDASETRAFVSGSAYMLLSGTTSKFVSTVSGDGALLAYGLQSSDTEATIIGAGNSQVFSSDRITATVSGSGRIHYKGNPTVENTSVSGLGMISKP